MSDSKNQYGKNFREAVARIEKLPSTERSAMSNRQTHTAAPKPLSSPPKRSS